LSNLFKIQAIKISEGHLGLVLIVEDGKLLGLVTDGDIRRAIQTNKNRFFDFKIKMIMNTHPITIKVDTKLVEAELIFQEKQVNNIIVLDNQEQLVGVLEYRSCQI
jgi:arabinose-5-phosphate isomerase